jgi:hypothetical protein
MELLKVVSVIGARAVILVIQLAKDQITNQAFNLAIIFGRARLSSYWIPTSNKLWHMLPIGEPTRDGKK